MNSDRSCARGSVIIRCAGGADVLVTAPVSLRSLAHTSSCRKIAALSSIRLSHTTSHAPSSCVQAALDDASRALDYHRIDLKAAKRAAAPPSSALLREARALAGLGRHSDAGNSFLQALNSCPNDASLPEDFNEMLPLLHRTRTYHLQQPRNSNSHYCLQQPKHRPKRVIESGDVEASGKVPSAPAHIYIAKGTGPAAKWKVSWEAPADTGSDTIYE